MPAQQHTNTDHMAIDCRGLIKNYGNGSSQVAALRGVDLRVGRGELFMLIGPSGCGKTTLLSVISGILDQDEGQCVVFGQDLKQMPAVKKTRFRGQHIGFVFQLFNLLPALTSIENVSVPLLLNDVPRKQALAQALEVLDRVGLGERLHALPAQLSGGQQQRVAIARALVHHPQLVICDEPTSNLDHKTGQKVMQMLKDVAQRNDRTLVIVTHDTRILNFADRVATMDDGKIGDILSATEIRRLQ